MSSLNRTIPFAKMKYAAINIAKNLNQYDVGPQSTSSISSSEAKTFLPQFSLDLTFSRSSGWLTSRIPFPPPPAAALIIKG